MKNLYDDTMCRLNDKGTTKDFNRFIMQKAKDESKGGFKPFTSSRRAKAYSKVFSSASTLDGMIMQEYKNMKKSFTAEHYAVLLGTLVSILTKAYMKEEISDIESVFMKYCEIYRLDKYKKIPELCLSSYIKTRRKVSPQPNREEIAKLLEAGISESKGGEPDSKESTYLFDIAYVVVQEYK